MKKILNEGNQIHNFISSSGSGSDFLTSYGSGSGSTSQKVTAPTVPVPQRCLEGGDDPPPGRLEDVLVRPIRVHLAHPSRLTKLEFLLKIAHASKMFQELNW
jgi:hypothetical protein